MTAGAWTALEVPLTASNGTLGASSVFVAPGATLSNAVTFTPDSDPNTVLHCCLHWIQCPPCQRQFRRHLPESSGRHCGHAFWRHLQPLAESEGLHTQCAERCQRLWRGDCHESGQPHRHPDVERAGSHHFASSGDFAGLSKLTGLNLANRNISQLAERRVQRSWRSVHHAESLQQQHSGQAACRGLCRAVQFDLPRSVRHLRGSFHAAVEVAGGWQWPGACLSGSTAHPQGVEYSATGHAGGSLSASSVTIAAGTTISQSVTLHGRQQW